MKYIHTGREKVVRLPFGQVVIHTAAETRIERQRRRSTKKQTRRETYIQTDRHTGRGRDTHTNSERHIVR